MTWVRTCQECLHKQEAKPPPEYKGDSWKDVKCKRCKSASLDYGSEKHSDPDEFWNEDL